MVIDRYIESLIGSRRSPPAPSSQHEAFLERALDRFLETLEIRRYWWLERQAAWPQGTNGWIWFQNHIDALNHLVTIRDQLVQLELAPRLEWVAAVVVLGGREPLAPPTDEPLTEWGTPAWDDYMLEMSEA